jgi:hypothetical protein
MTIEPIHQFDINNLFTIGHIGGRRRRRSFGESSVRS